MDKLVDLDICLPMDKLVEICLPWTNWLKYVYLWTNWLKFVYLWINWLKRVKPGNILAETSLPGPGKTFKIGSPRDKRDETGLPG